MKLTISRSKNSISFYLAESYRNEKGHSTTRTIAHIGTEQSIKEKYGQDIDAVQWAKDYVAKLNQEQKAKKPTPVTMKVLADVPYDFNEKRSFNVGYLAIQKVLYSLDYKSMCKQICEKYKLKYEFEQILANLIYARILEPCSKQASFEYCKENLLECPQYEQHDVYRALDVIYENMDFIQAHMYKASAKVTDRDTHVLFYNCTNFYFEITQETDLLKYGYSKEHRPNPIVQFGLFTDGSGIPLGFNIFPGNQNEQTSLIPLEKKILKDFELSGADMIVCTDAGLASDDNRKFNAKNNRKFITIQPIKKLKQEKKDWALDRARSLKNDPIKPGENPNMVMADLERKGWRVEGVKGYFSLDDIDEDDPKNYNRVFYKEKILPPDEHNIQQRMIVTYSIKYKHFMERKRANDIQRAQKLINSKNIKKIDVKNSEDVRRYIKSSHTTEDGKEASNATFELDMDVINSDARFDGFYAVCTSISSQKMSVAELINVNKGRWEIEESFQIMKTEFRSRPVYVQNNDRIKAHFTTCFLSLLVFRILEKEVNSRSANLITAPELVDTLRKMRISKIDKFYTGSFIRTNTTECIQNFAQMRCDCEVVTKGKMDSYVKNSKKLKKISSPKKES